MSEPGDVAPRCPICGGTDQTVGTLAARDPHPPRRFAVCGSCAAIRLSPPDGPAAANAGGAARLGSKKRYGRDFAMTAMASAIVAREGLEVLWWQPGVSRDRRRIEDLPNVSAVHCWEGGTPSGPADVVIGNEVVQCQDDPAGALRAACQTLRDDGLMVLSTDLYDGSDPHSIGYLSPPAHRLMWSFEAVDRVVRPFGLTADCRVPEIAVARQLTRKRFLLITGSDDVRRSIRRFFGAVPLAPSEMPASTTSTRKEIRSAYEIAKSRGRRVVQDLWSQRPRRNDSVA